VREARHRRSGECSGCRVCDGLQKTASVNDRDGVIFWKGHCVFWTARLSVLPGPLPVLGSA